MRKVLSLLALLLTVGVFAQPRPETSCDQEGINIRVKTCTADANGDVVVAFVLENVGNPRDRFSLITTGSEVFDDEGNSYGFGTLAIGKANESFNRNRIKVNLPQGVPLKLKLRISKVDSAASMLRLIKINLGAGNLYMKNIPISRDGD